MENSPLRNCGIFHTNKDYQTKGEKCLLKPPSNKCPEPHIKNKWAKKKLDLYSQTIWSREIR